jgi:hypothetical protein
MIQVVIDTNVVVSANPVDAGPSAAIFSLAANRQFLLMCVYPTILAEYEEVLRRPWLVQSHAWSLPVAPRCGLPICRPVSYPMVRLRGVY